jgi:hypothetical protein
MKNNIPSAYVVHNLLALLLAVREVDVLLDPLDEAIFEGSFDDLMQDVRHDELVNIGAWKVVREGLSCSRQRCDGSGRDLSSL